MKKIVYLCGMMLLSFNMMAQINLGDGWTNILDEQFAGTGRSWDSSFIEQRPASLPPNATWEPKWRVNAIENKEGVTKKKFHHAYQRCNTLFNNGVLNDNKVRLVAQCVSEEIPLECDGSYPTGYELPKPSWHRCDTAIKNIFYYSGNIQSYDCSYHYGYYEIECALPVHNGIHTSFWLWGGHEDSIADFKRYEEIDIMEYSETDWDHDEYRGYSSGIWFKHQSFSDSLELDHYGYTNFHMALSEPDIRQMHTYGCEWMPDHVVFYRDGKVTLELHDETQIPKYPKYIKTGYMIDWRATKQVTDDFYDRIPEWLGPDTITINYIKAYTLNTDCQADAMVQNAQQLNQLNSMKRSITVSNPNGIALPATTDKTLRAADYILISGPFELAANAQLTLIVHECPECIERSPSTDKTTP